MLAHPSISRASNARRYPKFDILCFFIVRALYLVLVVSAADEPSRPVRTRTQVEHSDYLARNLSVNRGNSLSPVQAPKFNTLWLPDLAGLIVPWGYPLESHWVTTSDGYILEVFRLPQRNPQSLASKLNPVLLMHGLLV
jgi:hypothetical protein